MDPILVKIHTWAIFKFTHVNIFIVVTVPGACEWNGLLYVVGGYDGTSCLSSVERYDPLTLTWTSVAAMNLRRRYLRIAVLGTTTVEKK